MRLLKDKRFRYGTFSTIMMLLAAAMFIFINLLAGEFNRTHDLTNEQIFTLSDESLAFLSELERDVTLTLIAAAGQELPGVLENISRITKQLLEEYADASPRVRIETRDPMLNPVLIRGYAEAAEIGEGIPDFSVVVESGGQIRVVQPHETIEIDIDERGIITRITAFNIEREITRAIQQATRGEATVVYYVTGSGELSLPPGFLEFMEGNNFEIRDVNLVLEEVPDDAEILFIPMPMRDWTEIKAGRILSFLEDEGRAFFALTYFPVELPNFTDVLDAYGVVLSNKFVLEVAGRNTFANQEFMVIPNMETHGINENLISQNFSNIVAYPTELQISDVRRTTLEAEPLWTTSNLAFARGADSQAVSMARTPSDTPGPFPLALAVTDRIFIDGTAYYTKIVIVSSFDFLNPEYMTYIGMGNWHFALNAFNWMQDRPPGIWIPSKTAPGQMPLLLTGGTARLLGFFTMGGIPLIFLTIGGFVWLRRRNA